MANAIHTFQNIDDGIEANVYESGWVEGHYNVVYRDIDADEMIGCHVVPTEEMAIAKAKAFVEGSADG